MHGFGRFALNDFLREMFVSVCVSSFPFSSITFFTTLTYSHNISTNYCIVNY